MGNPKPKKQSLSKQRNLLRKYTEQALQGHRVEAALDAVALVQTLPQLYRTDDEADDADRSLVTYNAILAALKAYAAADIRRNWTTAVKAAQFVMEIMQPAPDVVSYTTYMNLVGLRGHATAAKQVEQLWRDLPVPTNDWAINAVLLAWTTAAEPTRALQLLKTWQADPQYAQHLNTASYASVMAGFTKAQSGGKNPNERFEIAKDIWQSLWKRYEQQINDKVAVVTCRPNLHALTIFLTACHQAKQPQAAQDALYQFYQLPPLPATRNKEKDDRNDDDSGDENDDVINAQVVTSVLDSWQKSGHYQSGIKAQALVEWMVQEFEKTGNEAMRPNAYTFSSAIAAWARSRSFDKAAKAQALLKWMHQLHQQGVVQEPANVFVYTAVLNSCAYVEKDPAQQKQALDIAIATYKDMQAQQMAATPTHVSYAAMLTALRNLVPVGAPQRLAAMTAVFRDAAAAGQVCDLVLHRLQTSVSSAELRAILQVSDGNDNNNISDSALSDETPVTLQDLPHYWTRNLPLSLRP